MSSSGSGKVWWYCRRGGPVEGEWRDEVEPHERERKCVSTLSPKQSTLRTPPFLQDPLTNQYGLSDTGTTKETDLATSGVRGEEVDDLDTGLEDFGYGRLVDERGGFGVDRHLGLGLDGPTLVDGFTDDVHDSAQALWSDWNHDWGAGVDDLGASDETLGTYGAVNSGGWGNRDGRTAGRG